MTTEKADAMVIRQADFSESSRVVTFFSREFGKLSLLAKGAKRLKGPFDAALDLLSTCRIVFIRKSSGALGILTQAQLSRRFAPIQNDINSFYGGYYVADLLNGLTEDFDPDPGVFDLAAATLEQLGDPETQSLRAIVTFEVKLLGHIGLFPDLAACSVCGEPVANSSKMAHWVGQGGLLCAHCRRPEYADRSISSGTIAILKNLNSSDSRLVHRVKITDQQLNECHRLAVSAITNALGKKPGTLRYLAFP